MAGKKTETAEAADLRPFADFDRIACGHVRFVHVYDGPGTSRALSESITHRSLRRDSAFEVSYVPRLRAFEIVLVPRGDEPAQYCYVPEYQVRRWSSLEAELGRIAPLPR